MTTYARGPALGGDQYIDKNGRTTWDKYHDEQKIYVLDFTDLLDSGETIASHTWLCSGPTMVSSVLATPVITVKVSGTGTANLKLTTSTQVRELHYRWRSMDKTIGDYS